MTAILFAAVAGAVLTLWGFFHGRLPVAALAGALLVGGVAASVSGPAWEALWGAPAVAVFFLMMRGRPSRRAAGFAAVLAIVSFSVGYLSGGEGAPGGSPGWLARLGLSPEAAEIVIVAVRKTIHFTGYGILAVVAARASGVRTDPQFGLGAALIFATFDESRQSLSPFRSGSAFDVVLDLIGAAVFLWFTHDRWPVTAPETAPHRR